jgi:hypothetical protein
MIPPVRPPPPTSLPPAKNEAIDKGRRALDRAPDFPTPGALLQRSAAIHRWSILGAGRQSPPDRLGLDVPPPLPGGAGVPFVVIPPPFFAAAPRTPPFRFLPPLSGSIFIGPVGPGAGPSGFYPLPSSRPWAFHNKTPIPAMLFSPIRFCFPFV